MRIIGGRRIDCPLPSLNLFKSNDPNVPINGVGRLPAALTINGITEYPQFRYTAGGGLVDLVSWKPWGYGADLGIAGAGADPTLEDGSPFLGGMDDAVLFNAGKYYQAGENNTGDITTEDFVVELIIGPSANPAVQHQIMDKRLGASLWTILTSAVAVILYVSDGVGAQSVTSVCAPTNWCHAMLFVDRSGSGQWYVNGATSGGASSMVAVGNLTCAAPLTIGAQVPGGAPADSPIAYAAMWKHSSWLDTHLQAAVALQRFQLLTGVYPHTAEGTETPTVMTRASAAYSDKQMPDGTRKLFYVSNNHLRLCSRLDGNGKLVKGYLPERQVSQLMRYSQTFNSWVPVRLSVTVDSETAPDGSMTGDILHEDNTPANTHTVYTTTTGAVVSGVTYCCSIWAKKINRDWVSIRIFNGATTKEAWFDLTNGVASATGRTLSSSGIIDYGNGWFRCYGVWVSDISASATPFIDIAEGAGDSIFDGLNQHSLYVWGAQFEAGNYPSSYIPNPGATTVIRQADQLRYKGDDGNIGGVGSNKMGEVRCNVLLPDYAPINNLHLFAISDGGAGANLINLYTGNTFGYVTFSTAASGGSAGIVSATTDVANGNEHTLRATWKTDEEYVLVDSTLYGPDNDCDIPDDLDRIEVGAYASSILQPNGLLNNIKIYPRVAKK